MMPVVMARALASAVLFILASAALAQELAPLPGAEGRVALGAHVDVLEDPGGKLRLEDVRRPEVAARFARASSDPVNFGYTDSAWWLRFSLPGGAPADEALLLEIAFPIIDRIDFHLPEPRPGEAPRYWTRVGGDAHPWEAREVKHRNFVFRFGAPRQPGPHEYYLRVESGSVLTVPLTLWRPEAFAARDRDAQLLLGLFYGLALAMVLYNLMLYSAIRDRTYLVYVLYATAFGLFLFSYDGLAYQYLWPGSSWLANHAAATTLSLALALGALFARTFLDTPRIAPRADRAILAIVAAGFALAACAASGALLAYGAVLRAVTVLGFAVALLSTVVAVRALLGGYRPARFFLLAWAALLGFIVLGALRNFALAPTNFVTIYGLHFGFAFDVLLLSFALGDRIRLLRRERGTAQAEALASQELLLQATRESERALETRIAVRTAELNRANERLRAEAAERDQLMAQLKRQEEHLRFMAQHDPLTGLPNRISMQQRLALALELAKRNRKKVAVMMVDLDEFKRINDTRGHPAGDQALVQLAARLRTSVRGSDTVARYGGDEFVILAGELDRAEDAGMVAEKVADMIQVPLALQGGPAQVRCSIGISVFPDDAQEGEALIALADKAMYASKAVKGKRYAFFGEGLER
jgi:diguanylate cyclase (GGDEF)-like protein